MGTLPQLQPVQIEDPLQQYGRVLAIRQAQQNQQYNQQAQPLQIQGEQQRLAIEQQQIADTKALTQAMQNWDGKSLDELPSAVLKAGGSANAVFSLQKQILAQHKELSDIAKNDAETGSKNLETLKGKNDLLLGKLQTVNGASDAELPQALMNAAQEAAQSGLLDPQHMQSVQQMAQLPPQQLRQALSVYEKSLMGSQAQLEAVKKQAEARDANANAALKEQESQLGGNQAIADAKYRFLQQKLAAKQPISPDDANFVKAYEKQKLLVPATVAQIRVEGMGNLREYPVYDQKTGSVVMATPQEINRAKTEEPGRYTAAGYTPEAEIQKQTGKTFGPGGKGSEEILAFQTAQAHADLLQQAADGLKNGNLRLANQAANQLGIQLGSDKATNFQTIANAYTREVTKALSAGHLTDSEIKQQGATIPSDASPAQISGALNAYKNLMASKVQLRQKQFEAGKQGKTTLPQGGSGFSVTDPNGGVHTFKSQADADAFKKAAGIQ